MHQEVGGVKFFEYLNGVSRGGGRTEWANAVTGRDPAVTYVWLFVICTVLFVCFCLCSDMFMERAYVCLASLQSQRKV